MPNRGDRQVVGRAAEVTYLEQCLARAQGGERQIVFVTGEPGIGKTTLVETFLAQLETRAELWIGHGQCVEQYGAGEAYLPVLEAVGRLCQAPDGAHLIAVLRQYAPTWLVQLPFLVTQAEIEALHRQLQNATRERMLREAAQALTGLPPDKVLVLILEDLHWSDHSTLELIAYLAHRREAVPLLLIGTYRPAEVLASGHPLKGVVQELHARGQCEELALTALSETAVGEYLGSRLAGSTCPPELAGVIHRRTEGNPLFMVNIMTQLLSQGILIEEQGQWRFPAGIEAVERELPDNLRQLIEKHSEGLEEEERQLIEVASVAGTEFAAAAVAAGLEQEVEAVEVVCEGLARKGQFIRAQGIEEWPDGTLSERYRFQHGLYQNVFYERMAETRRARLHKRLGAYKETAYGHQASTIAAELAMHFERGRDLPKAVHYLEQAGRTAAQRHAYQDAIRSCQHGLRLLETLPDSPERVQQELTLQMTLGPTLIAVKGYAAPEVERVFRRSEELSQALGRTPQLFPVLGGLFGFFLVRAELSTAQQLAAQMLQLAQQTQKPARLLDGHFVQGQVSLHLGEVTLARDHLHESVRRYLSRPRPADPSRTVQDTGVAALSYLATALWVLGYPDQALARITETVDLAHGLKHPLSLVWALNYAAAIHRLRRERQATAEQTEAAVQLATDHDLPFWVVLGQLLRSWALSQPGQEEKQIAQFKHALSTWQAMGSALGHPNQLALLAELHQQAGQAEAGLGLVETALHEVRRTGERWYEAELYRLKGELLLAQEVKSQKSKGTRTPQSTVRSPESGVANPQAQAEAEACFQQALTIARQQDAKSWELRAAVSLSKLWHQQGKTTEARQLLEEIYSWFTEGFETKDLQEAEVLLSTVGGHVEQKPRLDSSQAAAPTPAPSFSVQPAQRPPLAQSSATPEPSQVPDAPRSAVADAIPPQPSPLPVSEQVCRQEGDYWTLVFEGTTCRLKDSRGMHYLAQLLWHPNTDLHVLTLAARTAGSARARQSSASQHDELVVDASLSGMADAGEILDPQARAAYKDRVEELHAELTEALRFNDLGRSERLQAELDFLTQELAQAAGLGGRARKTNSPVERARSNITKTLKATIKRITARHPALGQHLARTIRTGTWCVYAPDPRLSLSWQR